MFHSPHIEVQTKERERWSKERITAIHQWTRILAGQNKSPPSIPKELLSAIPLGERPMQGSSCLHQGQGYATIHDSIEG